MKYASWNLSSIDTNYMSGPQEAVKLAGGNLVAGMSGGSPEQGSKILGYIMQDFVQVDLSTWNFQELSQHDALLLAQSWDESSFVDDDGFITAPRIDFSYQ